MKSLVFTLLGTLAIAPISLLQAQDIAKPDVIRFGLDLPSIQAALVKTCSTIDVREITPIELPTARQSQKQIDCHGFMYAGKPRLAEFVFADDTLDMVWILTEPQEESMFVNGFAELFGPPSHKVANGTFFLDNGTAVRNEPHEVLFLSDRLKEPFRMFLEN